MWAENLLIYNNFYIISTYYYMAGTQTTHAVYFQLMTAGFSGNTAVCQQLFMPAYNI